MADINFLSKEGLDRYHNNITNQIDDEINIIEQRVQNVESSIAAGSTSSLPPGLITGYVTTGQLADTTLGSCATAEGVNTTSSNDATHAEGYKTIASGKYSHAEGASTTASGYYCHAEGYSTTASGNTMGGAHAEGRNTVASGNYSHAEGFGTKASMTCTHAEGTSTTASGDSAHAEGHSTTASGSYSHAEGYYTTAAGGYSHAEGYYTNVPSTGSYGHTEGYYSQNLDKYGHAEGYQTTALGEGAHSEGWSKNVAANLISNLASSSTPNADIIAGWKTNAFSLARRTGAHTEGYNCLALGTSAHAEGFQTQAIGNYAHAEGNNTQALGNSCHAEGDNTIAGSEYETNAHAEGYNSRALAMFSHAEGQSTANARFSHAEGNSRADGGHAHSEGCVTIASGAASHSGGNSTQAIGDYSHSSGYYTKASNLCSYALGKCNKDMTVGSITDQLGDALIIGNGSTNQKSNAFRVTFDGTVYGLAAFNSSGADYAEFIYPWHDNNINNEDRIGYFVTFKDNKLYKATAKDPIIGIISGNPSIIGNSDEDYYWKYERDEFNRIIFEDVEEMIIKYDEKNNLILDENNEIVYEKTGNIIKKGKMKINNNYDASLQNTYIERKNRQEWDYVGMVGVIPTRDDGTCIPGQYCKCNDEGIATFATFEESITNRYTYLVLERITENVIKIIIK